jgi:hypothetical protein
VVNILYHLRRMLKKIYSKSEWITIMYELKSTDILSSGSLPDGYRILHSESMTLSYRENHLRNERVRTRQKTEIGLGVAYDDSLVYDTWIVLGKYVDPNTGILTDPGEHGAVLLDSYTDPDHRGKRIHQLMIAQRLKLAKELNLDNVGGLVYRHNLAALKAQKANGAKVVQRTVLINLLGIKKRIKSKIDWHDLDLD